MLKTLFKIIFRKDPTSKWIREISEIVIDIKLLTLQGAHLGDSINTLSCLGPADVCKYNLLEYYSYGLNICFNKNHLIEEIAIIFKNEEDKVFNGRILFDGQIFTRESIMTIDAVKEILSIPTDEVEDRRYITLIYQHKNGCRTLFTFEKDELVQINLDQG